MKQLKSMLPVSLQEVRHTFDRTLGMTGETPLLLDMYRGFDIRVGENECL